MSGLASIDVNLLVALDVLLQERHVTRAATRAGITQSAMSQTLQRARALLDDPLLVRQGSAMVPTPRAEALAIPLRTALRDLERAMQLQPEFEPERSSRAFRIALFDVYGISLVPRLLGCLQSRAPSTTLEVVPVAMERIADQLRDGDVDVALVVPRERSSDLRYERALTECMVSMVRKGHPGLDGALQTLEGFVRWPHGIIRITGRGTTALDRTLAAQGTERRVAARVPYFLGAPALACHSDLVLTLPRSCARAFCERWPVVLFSPPVEASPYDVEMTWSRHQDADGAHRWFRQQVRDSVRALTKALGPVEAGPKAARS